jgi:ubiquinone/menaquinone biosynthesis C-methylase UbiE
MDDLGLVTVADYVLAVEGLALARSLFVRPEACSPRVEEIAGLLAARDTPLLSTAMRVTEYGVEEGYERWAPRYDGPNPALELEQPLIDARVRSLPVGVALDAACGTGRHAAALAAAGWDVIGVDRTSAMLDVARTKVPDGDFRTGVLESLPVDDGSVDLVVCTLALTHIADLRPAFAEMARVLRPGGVVLTSDIHPTWTMLMGGPAGFTLDERSPLEAQAFHFVLNRTHQVASYVDAIHGAGLTITGCDEPLFGGELVRDFPTYPTLPDATEQALGGLPFLLVWEARKPATASSA